MTSSNWSVYILYFFSFSKNILLGLIFVFSPASWTSSILLSSSLDKSFVSGGLVSIESSWSFSWSAIWPSFWSFDSWLSGLFSFLSLSSWSSENSLSSIFNSDIISEIFWLNLFWLFRFSFKKAKFCLNFFAKLTFVFLVPWYQKKSS